jgi:uncharacterized membrane protein
MKVRVLLFAMIFSILGIGLYAQQSCNVLLIWDTNGGYTPNLVTALQNAGISVTLSQTSLTGYDGTNPAPTGFGCVILLDGTTYNEGMPASGQQALVSYVQSGGGFIGSEWLTDDITYGYNQYMRDLILFDRLDGWEGPNTYTVVPGMESHPVLAGIPSSFSFETGYNRGPAHTFATDPVTVLMTDIRGSAAVAVRQFGAGRVVGFNHAGNYQIFNGTDTLANPNIQQLYVNGVEWACRSRFDMAFHDDGNASALCVNSTTGAFQWSVAGGPTYTGTLHVYNRGTLFWSQGGPGPTIIFNYFPSSHVAWGFLYDSSTPVYSRLHDSNTLDDPPGCGVSQPPV